MFVGSAFTDTAKKLHRVVARTKWRGLENFISETYEDLRFSFGGLNSIFPFVERVLNIGKGTDRISEI